jgi:hypothetical protein
VSCHALARRPALRTISAVVCTAAAIACSASSTVKAESLPFDTSNPLIWDNDSESDAFSLALALALANNGELNLIGISQSPHPYKHSSEHFEKMVAAARASGWKHAPDATWDLGPYYMTALTRPGSGRIDETTILDTAPARMIRDKVLQVGTERKPVVIGTGGALTTVANAYLLARRDGKGDEFARKSIVAASIGAVGYSPLGMEYNAQQDSWALFIVLDRLHVVLTPLDMGMSAGDQQRVWQQIEGLPNTPMGSFVKGVIPKYPYDRLGGVVTGDMQPLIAMLHPQEGVFFRRTALVQFDSWKAWPSNYPNHGPNALNLNAFKQLLHVRPGTNTSALFVDQYNLRVVANTVVDAFAKAF